MGGLSQLVAGGETPAPPPTGPCTNRITPLAPPPPFPASVPVCPFAARVVAAAPAPPLPPDAPAPPGAVTPGSVGSGSAPGEPLLLRFAPPPPPPPFATR